MTDAGPPDGRWPISQYVLKVHSRCDLACDHCYVYEHADQGWRRQPKAMAPRTALAAADRIATHAAAHRLPAVTIVLHGGEPLLLGPQRLDELVTILRRRIDPVTRLDLRMQSNGVRLSAAYCDLLVKHDIRMGVSLDGDAIANDRHRKFANGASSHAKVLDGLALLRRREYRDQYAGILCTVDVANDPAAVYAALRAEAPPRLDLLLPHATWEQPPPRPGPGGTPYADWLLAVHELWTADGRPMPIRMFDSIRSTGAGGPSGNEWLGLDRADLLVVETDGTWEQVDSLKTAFDGAAGTGRDVFTHAVDDVAGLPDVTRRQIGLDALAAQCRACPVVRQCGGGLFAHRYRAANGFDNPSAYCADLKELIVSLNDRDAATPPGPAAAPARDARTDEHLPAGLLERIGAGRTDAGAVAFLADTQLSLTRALVVAVADGGSATAAGGWELLARVDQEAPAAVDATLAHPYVRVWAVDALHRRPLDTASSGYLACVAAAAAVRAGVSTHLDVPIRDGTVHLPGLGTLVLDEPAAGIARLDLDPDGCTISHRGTVTRVPFEGDRAAGGARWLPNRPVGGDPGDGGDVLLEDLDPHRDCHDWKAAERLAPGPARHWSGALAETWRVMRRDAPDHVGAVTAGLRAVVPLVEDPTGLLRSSTARQAFGAVAMARTDADAMAVMVVHEFQHNILGALLDVCDLFDRRHEARLTVGWRADPRPVEGALQGTYAHLAVTDMWLRRAARPGAGAATAAHYEQYRAWTADAAAALAGSGALTAAGERFVAHMAAVVADWPR